MLIKYLSRQGLTKTVRGNSEGSFAGSHNERWKFLESNQPTQFPISGIERLDGTEKWDHVSWGFESGRTPDLGARDAAVERAGTLVKGSCVESTSRLAGLGVVRRQKKSRHKIEIAATTTSACCIARNFE
jgi:hypothetical protein